MRDRIALPVGGLLAWVGIVAGFAWMARCGGMSALWTIGLTKGGQPSTAFRHYMQGWQAAQTTGGAA